MKKDCECYYCKYNVDEYFCGCGCNFNKCESYFESIDPVLGGLPVFPVVLCPKCYPENWKPVNPYDKNTIVKIKCNSPSNAKFTIGIGNRKRFTGVGNPSIMVHPWTLSISIL